MNIFERTKCKFCVRRPFAYLMFKHKSKYMCVYCKNKLEKGGEYYRGKWTFPQRVDVDLTINYKQTIL